jgi:hypothetical protein
MISSAITMLTAYSHQRELRQAAARSRHGEVDAEATPVTRVTLRRASAADAERLHRLAELDSGSVPSGGALVAEVDGRLRAALPLDGGAPLADPFHRGAELIDLLRMRARQIAR